MSLPSILLLYVLVVSHLTCANVLLIGKDKTLSFEDIKANFVPMIKKSDQRGVLYVAEPIEACSDLANIGPTASPPYVLIIRGGCSFEDKIKNAQKAGYRAAIVYDNQDDGFLVSMSGNPSGVHIYGTFVSKATGEVLKEYDGRTDMELWLMPSSQTSEWTIMTVSFIFLLTIFAVFATIFFLRRHRVRRRRSPYSPMATHLIGMLRVITFTGDCQESSSTSTTCAICLKKYKIGDKLRILPCHHKFHVECIDEWLGKWKSYCPVCRCDARTVTEVTPLLSPSASNTTPSDYLSITI